MTKKSSAVAKKDKGEQLPAHLRDRAGEAPRGSEEVRAEDLLIPRLEVCQSLSPVRKKADPNYIEGIEEGHLFDSITGEFWNEVTLVPVLFRPEYLIWKAREKGGGFRGAFPTKELAAQAWRELDDKDDCEIADHHAHYCLLIEEDGSTREIALSLARSKMSVSKKWNSVIRMTGLDRFARSYKITTTHVDGPKGDYYNMVITPNDFAPEGVYKKAEELYEAIKSGAREVRVDQGKTGEGDGDGDEF